MFNTVIHRLRDNFYGNNLYMKRDDLIPLYFGGNKVRKAALFFKDLADKNRDWVVTYGSISSNHCRVVANIAASKGIGCTIVSPPANDSVGFNRRLAALLGARVVTCPLEAVKETIAATLAALSDAGFQPYFIPGGGHGELGVEAYVLAYQEICAYEHDNGVFFDYIFLASGTGATQAGLVCGQLLRGDQREIIGVSIARKNPAGAQVVRDSIASYMLGRGAPPGLKRLSFVDDYVLAGYGSYNEEIITLIKAILLREGVPLDVIYTGKAFWGMRQYIRQWGITGKNILFIHTGGTPLFFDRLKEVERG